jgi:hypothetical protein
MDDSSTRIIPDNSADGVVNLLERAARTVDRMWRESQLDGDPEVAVALGEASYGVHRALIALRSTDPVGDPALHRPG